MNYREKIRKAIECPQFGNNGYGEWGALRYDQRVLIKRLLDDLDSADGYILKMQKEKQELIEYLKENKNELYKKLSDYNDLARIGKETDIEFFEALILERKIDVYEEILNKIEKR